MSRQLVNMATYADLFRTQTYASINPRVLTQLTLTVDRGLAYIPGNSVVVVDTLAPTTKRFEAYVLSYSGTSLTLHAFQNIVGFSSAVTSTFLINLDGIDGPPGPAGAMGVDGATGATGPAGTNGSIGATGPAGTNGSIGATGPAGTNGSTGPAGVNGSTGATGSTGPAGAGSTITNYTLGRVLIAGATSTTIDTAASLNFASATGLAVTTATQLQQVSESIQTITSATGTVAHNWSLGSIFNHTSISGNFTPNITNIPTTDNRIYTITLILNQGLTPYYANAIQILGVAQTTINWVYGTLPQPLSNKKDIQTFTLLRAVGSWTVFGDYGSYG
jgi:hypothetical protein